MRRSKDNPSLIKQLSWSGGGIVRALPVRVLQCVDLTLSHGTARGVPWLVLHPGVDAVLAVIGDRPADSLDPYRIEFPSSRSTKPRFDCVI